MYLDMKLFKTKKATGGFTLIELLVVIGILGILAATLFFTINPLEQLNRGTDASHKTAAEGFVNAANSFFATQKEYPWGATTDCNSSVALSSTPMASGGTVNGCVTALINTGELNASYAQDTDTLSDVLVTETTNGFNVCFLPDSTAEANTAQAQFASDGTPNATCTPGTDCYWCLLQ